MLRDLFRRRPAPPKSSGGMLYSAETRRAIDETVDHFRRLIREGARESAVRQGRTTVEVADVRSAAILLMTADVDLSWASGLDPAFDLPPLRRRAAEMSSPHPDAARIDFLERRRLDLVVGPDGDSWAVSDGYGRMLAEDYATARGAIDTAMGSET